MWLLVLGLRQRLMFPDSSLYRWAPASQMGTLKQAAFPQTVVFRLSQDLRDLTQGMDGPHPAERKADKGSQSAVCLPGTTV